MPRQDISANSEEITPKVKIDIFTLKTLLVGQLNLFPDVCVKPTFISPF